MTLRFFRTLAAFVIFTTLLATSAMAQTHSAAPQSPYGGDTVEEIIVRVNDQIITRSDYDRAMREMDAEARQHGASMQEISAGHRDLLRNLIDQQLWLSKGKELGITGETELVNRLNEIRKQNNMETLEDLEKAAKEQGVSFEDFKANIRNGIITQQVMQEEVGKRAQFTPGEAERYFEQHKNEYVQPESVTLAEILVSTGTQAASATGQGGAQADDPAVLAAAKAKADDIVAKLHGGGDFSQLARSFSDGPTASQGGDLGQFRRGALAKVLEDQTFSLKAGQYTEPIRTRQGFVILKVVQHISGGVPAYKDVAEEVQQNFFMERMEPAMRAYLTTMRDQAFINYDTKRFTDTGASPSELKSTISFSAYTPPTSKKKKKVQRTRFRESTRSYRTKAPTASSSEASAEPAAAPSKQARKSAKSEQAAMKPGKKEKIRYGQAPSKTLPSAPQTLTEDAGAEQQTASSGQEPVNPLEPARPTQKTRFTARAKQVKQAKVAKGEKTDALAPAAPDAAEVADRQTQSGPLGLAGDTSKGKKKKSTATTGEKTRLADKKKNSETPAQNPSDATPAPAPVAAPAPQTQQ